MAERRGSGGGQAGRRVREQLGEYRRKRDFRRTAEPSGDTAPDAEHDALAFVIQKHAASHLHYDLRLELDGVMKSWAVPKGPSLDPSIKRLAMQVEDHPIEYNAFEGTIPEGEYGGGTVMLWDRGTYAPDDVPRGATPAEAVRKALRAGKLGFTLHGERLAGSFALVRTDAGPKPKWLLIKHRDDAADPGGDITAEVLTSVASGRTLEEITAESDRVWRSNRPGRPGGTDRRKQRSPASGDVIAPMLPTPARTPPETGEWTFEAWHGGTRVLAYATAEAAFILDAGGRDLTARHEPIAAELASLARRAGRPFVLDGEVVEGGDAAALHAADLLLDGEDVLMPLPWSDRRKALAALFRRRRTSLLHLQRADDDAATVLRRAAREGVPGIIARRLDAPYTPGSRTEAVLRIAAR
jgi:bifunctional non-homologous end joining protein LigD